MNYQERSGFEPYDMSWNDDESTPRTDLGDLLNPTGEAYEMPESRSPTPIDTPDEPGDTEDEHDVPHPSQESDLKKDIHHNFSQVSNLASMLEGVESTTESVSQHKYSRLAQSSYDYFNSKGNADLVNTNLKNPKYSHINDLNGFELDKELSTLDDAVLHNKLTGETVISFRGTTSNIKETKAFLKDWEVNSKIMFNPKSAENTRRMKNAFSNTENVISKYGKDIKVVGHSQGGYVSSSVAQKLDLEGHHYNPAISVRQINQNTKGMFFKNTAEQNIYKTHTDFASPLAYDRHIQKNFNVNTVNYNPEITERSPFVSTHSLEQFTPTVEEELGKGMVRCERNTLVSSFKNSLGPAVNVGVQAYSAGKDFQQDIKEGGGIGVETAKIGFDAAKNAEEYVVDNAIMDVGIAAAPETMGLSLLVAGAATMVFINKLADHSHHDDLRVDDELVVQKLKLPTNATVEGLTVSHIQGLSDSLGNLTIDESALLADVNTQIAGKADASSVYTQTELDTIHATFAPASTTYTKTQVDAGLTAKVDATTYDTGIALKADITALNATNMTLATKADASATTKANQTDVDTSLALKADLSALNTTNTTLTEKLNISDANTALALKVDTTDFNTLTATVNTKAPQASLDTTNNNLGTLTASVASLTTAVNSEALIQNTNSDVIIPQRGIPYPPKNITIPTNSYIIHNSALSPTLWDFSWTIGATDFTNVNGLKRKVYGVGDYNLSTTHQPTSEVAYTWVELTLPYAVVATGIEAVRRTDGATGTSSAYQSWYVAAAVNNGWVDLNMDNSVFETAGNPAYYPTQFREITGNTVSSNRYRVFRGNDEIGKYFDGFRIYSKDESPPAIPLGDDDGTTPEPGPDPDPTTPISFTVSWATNGGIIQANLVGIQDGDGTEVITLTRDDGSILATLASGSLGNHTLQHDEGTNYNTYTYTIRLDGVIESTFSRDYQPNVPTFTTNFFSNTAKRISCGIENIVNPHDSYSVRLARPDDTILDTQVLNDASSFFLQFTESDYGTYDYKLLLSKWTTTSTSNPNIPPESYWVDTVIATHQQIFVRPEPTFTTSWTKSGLTINADLSSITGAHPEFFAYLTRDDGTTLATHQFQTGQTTTSLTFTETEYGSYNYQLKLGTVVKSSHTETYVRPTPTYTASFSTSELTLTASITSITNAHNSFAITLERDDGTVLQTHTLVDGETSFTFSQTETSYATFNYVVKLNGAQTDTFSATYTPPPTPTFDIALTNDDLVITATLTNIVNPDPYYTFMIHDANDTHLDGHTFATGDTTVVLTWTETSYGEKTYTKLLNGASIGTETITLTDPNTGSTDPSLSSPADITGTFNNTSYNNGNSSGAITYEGHTASGITDANKYYYNLKPSVSNETHYIYFDASSNRWYDYGNGDPTCFQVNNAGTPFINPTTVITGSDTIQVRDGGLTSSYGNPIFTFTHPSYLIGDGLSTPTTPPDTLPNVAGTTQTYEYKYRSSDVNYYYYDRWVINSGGWANAEMIWGINNKSNAIKVGKTQDGDWFPSLNYQHQATDTTNTYYEYKISGAPTNTVYFIAYNWTTRKWFDTNPTTSHNTFGTSATDTGASGATSRETAENPAIVYVMGEASNTLMASFNNPYYEVPAYRTGTSKGFAFTSGAWKNNGYSAVLDDEANSSSGKLVNGVRQFEWDMPDIGGGRLYSGANNWIYFVPGTAEDSGTWYNSSTSTGGTAGTRNGRVISIGTSATFDETNAFVSGLVPYGDIP
ncbi:unnamed protein product [Bathycoccus prasinos]